MADRQAVIEAYNSAGFVLFPCGAGKENKAPAMEGWQQLGKTPKKLPPYYGVVLPPEVAVFDYDKRRDAKADRNLSALWKSLSLPNAETFIVRTANGYHVYYRKPADVYTRSRVPGFPAIDIKSAGGYVMGAGSAHFTGTIYEVVRGTPHDIAEIPEALLEYCKLLPRDPANQIAIESEDPDTVRRFTHYCNDTDIAVEGDGGDRQTFLVACMGKDWGLPEPAVLAIMDEYYNPRCIPEWEPDALAKKVSNAFEYGQNKTGYLHPKAAFANYQHVPTGQPAAEEPQPDSVLQESLVAAVNQKIQWTITKDKNTGENKLDNTLNNVLGFLRLMPGKDSPNPLYKLFRYDMFADRIEFSGPAPWHTPDDPHRFLTDTDLLFIKEFLTYQRLYVSTDLVREAVTIVAHDSKYHPVRDYLRSLKWDGVPRLDDWLINYCGATTNPAPYVRAVGKNTLMAACARVMEPGCQHDSMLVLEGPQGQGKGKLIGLLGGAWYAAFRLDPLAKDTIVKMQGRWIIEQPELEVLSRADVAALKAFLTLRDDVDRLPYRRMSESFPRQCVFIGTINPTNAGYLQDTTGNRRFWPVSTAKLDLAGIKRDRDQLFAEAMHRYQAGEDYYITDPVIEAMAVGEAAKRQVMDLWTEIIGTWLHSHADKLPTALTSEAVALHALNLTAGKLGMVESKRLALAMHAAGYQRSENVKNLNGKRLRVWEKIGKDDDDMAWL